VAGELWGRGALDMKSGIAMLTTAFLACAADEQPPPGDLLLVINSDEETGGELGAGFLTREHPELLAGVRHALSEFGGYAHHVAGRRLYPVQIAEKRRCTLRLTVRGKGGHGANPVHRQATAKLAAGLRALDRRRLPTHITLVVAHMLRAMAAGLPGIQRAGVRAARRPRATETVLQLFGAQANDLEPLLRNTPAPTVVRAGSTWNVIPTEASVDLDGRLLPGHRPDQLLDELTHILPSDVALDVLHADPPPARDQPDLSLLPLLFDVLREQDPGGHPFPLVAAGMTDARFYATLGIQTYGFLPLRLPPGLMPDLIHAPDERVPAASVNDGAHAICRAISRYRSVF
jgi:acetylornithine deacetylase/succinyl-diaminopimelate desuccinylase-like protein